jgi:hypothetical protein
MKDECQGRVRQLEKACPVSKLRLLGSTLQVDISFWAENEFRPIVLSSA